nr:transposase [Paenibacillus durus]
MYNWEDEIVNYHHCRWTNATVEGRHNCIKAYQVDTILHAIVDVTKSVF